MLTIKFPDNCPICNHQYRRTPFSYSSCGDLGLDDHAIRHYPNHGFMVMEINNIRLEIYYSEQHARLILINRSDGIVEYRTIHDNMPIPKIDFYSKEDILNKFELFKAFI